MTPTLKVLSLPELFGENELFGEKLQIPDYQRSYSWRTAHVKDLLEDTFARESTYLMGTIIVEEKPANDRIWDIVDGQQRLVTLTVLLHVLHHQLQSTEGQLPQPPLPLLKGEFTEGAAKVIRNTKFVIEQFLNHKSSEEKQKYFKRLNDQDFLVFTVLVLSGANVLDQAYAFFDSINSKGKPLSDFDLLKAHHLMFIPPQQEALATSHNNDWQSGDERHGTLFTTMLRRLRMWGRGQTRDSKRERPDYEEFCSVVPPAADAGQDQLFSRYMQPMAFRAWRREGEKIIVSMDLPVAEAEALIPIQVMQTIEGGDAFFLYAKRYHQLYERLFIQKSTPSAPAISFVRKMAAYISNLYLHNAFCAIILLAFDKFGPECLVEIAVCTERILSDKRWKLGSSVRIEGTLAHIHAHKIIPILLHAVRSVHVVEQLHAAVMRLPHVSPPPELKGVTQRYFESLKTFYKNESKRIQTPKIAAMANFYLNEPNTA